MRIVCLDGGTLNPGDLSWAQIEALGELTVHDRTPPGLVVTRAADAEIVLTNKTPLDEALAELPKLRYIGVLATGYNVVNVRAARDRGIVVTHVPTYGTESVAQFAFALLLELCHRVGLHGELVADGQWSRGPDFCFWRTRQVELAGKVLTVVGAGRIGRRVVELGLAFGMSVLAVDEDRGRPLPDGACWAGLDEAFAAADAVSLHVPLTPRNERLVDAARLASMKPTAFLINTSRGQVIDERALRDALDRGRIAGAALDVLSVEPPPPDHPLIGAPNCIVTPHIAWSSREARARLMDAVAENLRAFQTGRPINVVTA